MNTLWQLIAPYVVLFVLVLLQNASFTLVSRARNSPSILYHTIAAALSNGFWLLVIRQVVLNLDNWIMMVDYWLAATIGSVLMHYIAIKWIEKKKRTFEEIKKEIDELLRFPIKEKGNGVETSKASLQRKVVAEAVVPDDDDETSFWRRLLKYAGQYFSGNKWPDTKGQTQN